MRHRWSASSGVRSFSAVGTVTEKVRIPVRFFSQALYRSLYATMQAAITLVPTTAVRLEKKPKGEAASFASTTCPMSVRSITTRKLTRETTSILSADASMNGERATLPQSAAVYYYSLGKLHFTHKQVMLGLGF